MAVVKLTHKQEELIHNSARKCGFDDFEVDANVGTFKGDNYLGVITTVAVKEKNNGETLHLILKSAHTNEKFRNAAPVSRVFTREAHLYNNIFPEIFKFQSEKGLSDPFSGAAKFYDSCLENLNESILLENLKEHGYKLWDRKIPMNDEHVTLVFSEYARFHAASFALRHNHPEKFTELTQELKHDVFMGETPNPEMEEKFHEMSFKTGLAGVEGNVKVTMVLERLRKNITTLFSQEKEEDISNKVIIHGDCWCNNMLFHYEENLTPTKVCFIDWQLSRLGSPVLDLAYFFCACNGKEIIHQLPKYLKIYHKVLAKNLKESGCDPDKVFSFNTLMEQWKKHSWFGVYLSMMILKIMLADSSEVPDMVDALDKGQDLLEAFEYDMSKSSEYKTRLCDLVEYMSDNNYI